MPPSTARWLQEAHHFGIPLARADNKLVPEHPGVSANLRIAQVIAITALPDHPRLVSVLSEDDREFRRPAGAHPFRLTLYGIAGGSRQRGA